MFTFRYSVKMKLFTKLNNLINLPAILSVQLIYCHQIPATFIVMCDTSIIMIHAFRRLCCRRYHCRLCPYRLFIYVGACHYQGFVAAFFFFYFTSFCAFYFYRICSSLFTIFCRCVHYYIQGCYVRITLTILFRRCVSLYL